MTNLERNQILKHEASITRLEKLVSVIVRRLAVVEKENVRLKHAVTRANGSVSSIENKLK